MITRRGLFGFLAAPAIVRAASLMAVVPLPALFTVSIDDDPSEAFQYVGNYDTIVNAEAIKIWSRRILREALKETMVLRFAGQQPTLLRLETGA